MKKIDILNTLYKLSQTVFSLKELSLMFPEIKYVNLKRRVNNLVKKEKLMNPIRGILAKNNFSLLELACKVYTPSYVSLETILAKEGVIFQKYDTIFTISHVSRELKVGNNKIGYRRLKNEILLNNLGIERYNNYFVASKERAFTDAVYLYRDYHFDNLNILDWNLVLDLAKIYKSKAMTKRIMSYYNLYKKDHV
ncbi:MAG: hypothetical protein WC895_00590 [Candidatus Shapirobacteria bacterium]|jgi:hypothetical protein